MGKKFEYTTLANRYTARFPTFTYVGTQVNFWIIANILLVTIMHLQAEMLSQTYQLSIVGRFGPMLLTAVILGIIYGLTLGMTGYYMERTILGRQALGLMLLVKTLISLSVLIVVLMLLRYVFFNSLIAPSLPIAGLTIGEEGWKILFLLLVIYYFFMTLVISFVNQVNKKYGPGVLVPLLLGSYRNPKEEERIFMFMDLKASTTAAEELGHLKYSSFIRDCFSDINRELYPFQAQVYQYVGDEIVVTWPESEGLKDQFCLAFYFGCKRRFQERSDYYLSKYGSLPEFKAGAHTGTVTTVEIGEIKRDIAYHGDTLNTASRIQGVCNEFGKSFLVSKTLLDKVGSHPNIQAEQLGMIQLKGKTNKVELVSVNWIERPPASA